MRIRPAYVIILIVIALGAFVIYAALSGRDAPGSGTVARPSKPSDIGMLPPVDVNQEFVPIIEVETDTFDMGTIPNSEPTTKTMTVKNAGREKLVVREITTTCACTTGKLASMEIGAGETTTMEITVDPDRVSGFLSEKRLTIMCNAPNAPMKNVDVIARIDPEFETEPNVLDFGEVEKGQTPQRQLVLRQVGNEPIELLDVKKMDQADKGVSLTYSKRPESDWKTPGKPEFLITATLEPWIPIGEYSQPFVMTTSCKRVPRYRQFVKATVKAFYELSLKQIVFTWHASQSKDAPAGSVTVQADRPFDMLDIKVTGEDFIVKTAPGPTPNSTIIEVYLTEKSTPGRKNEKLTFSVKTPDGIPLPNIIPVSGTILDIK
ncbi:MAG TPA: DUF1573 domain-containing protein [Candidatus Hydrogenedentes bacterium]|nr:DUF1573 domain-containing protein [Candidatus Hydrogenedentota bacterium]